MAMKLPMTKLRASEIEDEGRMKHHLHMEYDVKASAERVFEVLAHGENQEQWADGYQKTVWLTSSRAVGSVRDIYLRSFTVRERFLVWEPGRRFAFSSDAMSPRVARELIEDVKMVPLSATTSRLVWDVHASLLRILSPLSSKLIRDAFFPMFNGFAGGLAEYATAHPDSPTVSTPPTSRPPNLGRSS